MKPAPLRWWSRAALAAAASAVEPAWQRWCTGWGVASASVVASNACDVAAPERLQLRWQPCGSAGPAAAWLGAADGAPVDALRALLFGATPGAGSSHSTSLAQEVADAAWRDLAGELGRCLPGPEAAGRAPASPPPEAETAPPAREWRPWSGAVSLQLDTAGADARPLLLHLSAQTAEVLLRSHAPASGIDKRFAAQDLSQLGDAIGRTVVHLSVELDGLALDFGTLQTLRPGDVLALQHRLDEPLHVCLPRDAVAGGAGPALCSALLGARGGRRAVELVREDTSA